MGGEREYHYKDVFLTPKYSNVLSRKDVDTYSDFGPMRFKLPVVPANMRTIISEELAIWLAQNQYFYIMHRFGVDNLKFHKTMRNLGLYSSISIGVNADSYALMKEFKKINDYPDYITIDIAHGFCEKMNKMLHFIRDLGCKSYVIAGNVCTQDATYVLASWGADCVKSGLSGGSACSTKLQTGFARPQFSAVLDCCKVNTDIIADGSISCNGDIAKALVVGAKMVMVGGMLAFYEESPGDVIIENGIRCKEFYGSASEFNKGEKRHVEGVKIIKPIRGFIKDKYKEIQESLQSSISYAGGHDIVALRDVNWVVQE